MSPRTDSNASTPTCFRFIEFLRTRVIFLPFLFSHRSPMVKRDDIFSMKRIELSFFPGKLIRIYYRPLSRYWKRNAYISVLFTFKPLRLIRIEKWKWVTNRRWIVIGRFLKNYPGISSTKRFEIRISFFFRPSIYSSFSAPSTLPRCHSNVATSLSPATSVNPVKRFRRFVGREFRSRQVRCDRRCEPTSRDSVLVLVSTAYPFN